MSEKAELPPCQCAKCVTNPDPSKFTMSPVPGLLHDTKQTKFVVSVPMCKAHGRWPCIDCGTKHYDGCECPYCVRPCAPSPSPSQGKDEGPRKLWPFVESPGEFADRLTKALAAFDGYVLGAVRNVLIENPPELASLASGPSQEGGVDELAHWLLHDETCAAVDNDKGVFAVPCSCGLERAITALRSRTVSAEGVMPQTLADRLIRDLEYHGAMGTAQLVRDFASLRAGGRLSEVERDAARFQKLQNMPPVEAQAFFWNYSSRRERAKAIDAHQSTRAQDAKGEVKP